MSRQTRITALSTLMGQVAKLHGNSIAALESTLGPMTSRFAQAGAFSYCGVALSAAAESDPVWKITRIEVAGNGTVAATLVATNVAWTSRLIVTYS